MRIVLNTKTLAEGDFIRGGDVKCEVQDNDGKDVFARVTQVRVSVGVNEITTAELEVFPDDLDIDVNAVTAFLFNGERYVKETKKGV